MWTPKRILLVISGLFLCLIGYGVYLYFLGDIDALPPLPREYWPSEGAVFVAIDDNALRWYQSFGPECEEVHRMIKLELHSKGWGMAANKFDIESDGRVKLTPFSAYLFPRSRRTPKFPEINTVRCDEAYLTMDRPVTNLGDLSNRRIVGVELRAKPKQGILIINNRSTQEKNDDIELRITNAPLFFDDNRSVVWTEGFVQVLDTETEPHPTKVTAQGMDLYLNKEVSTTRGDTKKRKENNNGSVEKLVLRANVDMHIFLDAKSGFLAGTQTAKPQAGATNEKSHLVIKTNGPFIYEVAKDVARFECPKLQNSTDPLVEHVLVQRQHLIDKAKQYDQLLCNTLVLDFKKKEQTQPRDPNERGLNKEIVKAHATAYPGREVVVSMDSEKLEAWGDEMIYYKATETTGAQTIVKGKPLRAGKDGHKIEAIELHLVGGDKEDKGQAAFAKGPGRIDLFDKAKNSYPLHALFKESMTVGKDIEKGPEGERILDLLTFKEDAVFVDSEQHKELRAKRIQVWLEPVQRTAAKDEEPPKSQLGPTTGRQRPHKLDAFKNVSATSAELIIPKADRVVVRFRDAVPTGEKLPETAGVVPPGVLPAPDSPVPTLPPLGADTTEPPANNSILNRDGDNKDRKPIVLEGREIAVYVVRLGSKNELQELVTEGGVHVQQDGKTPDDKGVDITGEMLNLLHNPKGDQLFVYGDTRKPAQLQIGELVLVGPKVTINQQTNIAEVEGIGAMTLPSNTSFDGSKPSKPGVRLTIHWNTSMLFNGRDAEFHGGVVGYQENSSLKCQSLQVALDKPVSFKTGQKSGQNAKVDRILCDRNVYILDEKKDAEGKRVQYNRLEATELAMDNKEGPTIARGPGMVYLIARGPADPTLIGAAPTKQDPAAKEEMLTRISYFDRMFSNKKPDSRTGKFYGNVEVFHLPSSDPDIKLAVEKLPKEGFYLRCDVLTVYTKNVGEGKATQQMQAEGRVDFRAREVSGKSTTVKYDDSSEIVIFEGVPGAPVQLYQFIGPQEPREIRGARILYNRRTGQFEIDGGNLIKTP